MEALVPRLVLAALLAASPALGSEGTGVRGNGLRAATREGRLGRASKRTWPDKDQGSAAARQPCGYRASSSCFSYPKALNPACHDVLLLAFWEFLRTLLGGQPAATGSVVMAAPAATHAEAPVPADREGGNSGRWGLWGALASFAAGACVGVSIRLASRRRTAPAAGIEVVGLKLNPADCAKMQEFEAKLKTVVGECKEAKLQVARLQKENRLMREAVVKLGGS
mmetsp:Transcript_2124/g.6461  ORF Transcript_2124/g.6461 Transcript_2124/m.6461 type:complete len:224 (-) Transcript_2124:131-802(-)